jgi:hypothetical protein
MSKEHFTDEELLDTFSHFRGSRLIDAVVFLVESQREDEFASATQLGVSPDERTFRCARAGAFEEIATVFRKYVKPPEAA